MYKGISSEITRVIIENFQSHEHTVLDFLDGLNVIVGPSDQGKSAVIRAIKWVLYNEPRGMDFIRHGAAFARVTLEMGTGYKIIRERSKGKNRYAVIEPNGDESVYEGFGNDIPKEVIEAHGIPKVILDADISSSLNISEQLEGPFLLSETGATRAKAIGRLTGTHIIDNAIRDSITDIRRESQTSDRLSNEIKGIDIRLEEYQELDLIKERLEASETIIYKSEQKFDRLHNFSRIMDSLNTIKNEKEKLHIIDKKLESTIECEDLLKICVKHIEDLKAISKFYKTYKELKEQLRISTTIINNTQEIHESEEVVKKIVTLTEKLNELLQAKNVIHDVTTEQKTVNIVLKNTEDIDKLPRVVNTAQIKLVRYIDLISKRERNNEYSIQMAAINKDLELYFKTNQALQNLDILKWKLERLVKLEELRDQYSAIDNYILEGIRYSENNKYDMEKLANEYADILKKLGRCPTCGSEVSESKLDEILLHYKEENPC